MSKPFGFEGSDHNERTAKPFSMSLPFRLSKARNEEEIKKMPISQIKRKIELSLQDLEGSDADTLRYKIRSSREVKDLWMLRTDIHQAISRHISQQVAAERINALLPCFEYWIPAKAMTKI